MKHRSKLIERRSDDYAAKHRDFIERLLAGEYTSAHQADQLRKEIESLIAVGYRIGWSAAVDHKRKQREKEAAR